jgi:hypothetical protein
MALNKDQQQLIEWYEQGATRVALRHGLSEQTMKAWLQDQGYYQTEQGTNLAERMLREFRAEQIGYEISCLDPIAASVLLLLLTDRDKDKDQTAEQINTIAFDVVYGIKDLADVDNDGTGLYQVSMTIVADTDLDQADVMDYVDQRLADLSEHESKLLELLASPQSQPRSYYYGLIDLYRALN